ncbi:MAG TPA: hypothetical protein VF516_00565 [Kofleriaceae bacterium]
MTAVRSTTINRSGRSRLTVWLILALADLVDQLIGEHRVDVAIEHARRVDDRFAQLLALQARHQVLAAIERLGKTGEDRAAPEIVGPQRRDDAHRQGWVRNGVEQQRHERVRFAGIRTSTEPDQLFELVDDDQQLRVRWQRQVVEDLGKAARAGAQPCGEQRGRVASRCGVEHGAQRLRKAVDRLAARPERGGSPPGATAAKKAGLQRRQQAGAHER